VRYLTYFTIYLSTNNLLLLLLGYAKNEVKKLVEKEGNLEMIFDSQPRMFPLKKKQIQYFEILSFHFIVKILYNNPTNSFFFLTLDNIDYYTPLSAIVLKLSYLLEFDINIVTVSNVNILV
jgi:hypothetical protein